jgi:TPP-dependent indolepyruvate ferredoxin oxidoreductase alpha subunit
MVPVMMTAQVLLTKLGIDIKLPIAETVALAGVVSAAYLGKRAIQANRQQAGA